jgi:hypothetical protein
MGQGVRVQVINEVCDEAAPGAWRLCFQWCRSVDLDEGNTYTGFRFIWRRPDGSLQAARGQARLLSIAQGKRLMQHAEAAGWGQHEAAD